MLLPKSGYKRHMVIFFYAIVFSLAVFLLFSLILKVLLPFLSAWLFAMAVRPLGKKAHRLTGISEKVCSIILCVLILLVVISLLLLGIFKLTEQIKDLPRVISDLYGMLSEKIDQLCQRLGAYLPNEGGIAKGADVVRSYFADLAKSLVNALSKAATNAAKNVPAKVFALIIFVISCVYFSADLEKINAYIYKILPNNLKKALKNVKKRFCGVMVKYIKAHLIMILLTFLMVYVGLVLIGYKYAAILAAVISILDFLPAIGLGTVFIPWAVVLFIIGNGARAIKLLILFAICETVNQIFRPKIIGSQLGIHPLATLIGLYVGFKLLGILGMFLSPLAVISVKFLLEYFVNYEKTIDNSA